MSELGRAISLRKRELDAKYGEVRSLFLRGKELQEEVASLTEEITILEQTNIFLNSMGEDKQNQAQQTIEELVTRGLQKIFDPTLSFHIIQNTKAKQATVNFVIRDTRDGNVVETDIMDARGGGLSATVGFLLRLVILLLKEGQDKEVLMVLDETFAHVSEEYIPALGEFLAELVDRTGIQLVMVTHQPEFAEYADKVVQFSNVNGYTKVKEVK